MSNRFTFLLAMAALGGLVGCSLGGANSPAMHHVGPVNAVFKPAQGDLSTMRFRLEDEQLVGPAEAVQIARKFAGQTDGSETVAPISLDDAKIKILGSKFYDSMLPEGERYYLVTLRSGGQDFGLRIPQPTGKNFVARRGFTSMQVVVREHGGKIVGLLAN